MLLYQSPEDLVEKQNISLDLAKQIISQKAVNLSPSISNIWTLYEKESGLLTSSPLDLLLPNGIPTSAITEISGPSGTFSFIDGQGLEKRNFVF
jgi:hypothetical protein